MTDKKLTDAEIAKDLECYRGQKLFAFNGKRPEIYIHDIIDLINRQEAEIKHLDIESDILRADVENLNRICDELNAENENLKAEVERLKKVEERHIRLYHLLLDPVIVANGKNGELRPIKRTSRQDVYHTLLRAQEIMKIPHRWFPWNTSAEKND